MYDSCLKGSYKNKGFWGHLRGCGSLLRAGKLWAYQRIGFRTSMNSSNGDNTVIKSGTGRAVTDQLFYE